MNTTIKIYDLKTQGLEFKADFNKFERIEKILHEIDDDTYRKIDLVTDDSRRLFLIKRFVNFAKKR